MEIQGKTAIVTGATGGIGLAVVRALASRGARLLALVDLSADTPCIAAEMETEFSGTSIRGFSGDVCDEEFRRLVFTQLEEITGKVDICVPAAGIVRDGLAVRPGKDGSEINLYPQEDFSRILEVNLTHPTYWAMETIASTARARQRSTAGRWQGEQPVEGVNILIGSVSSRGNRGQVGYAAAKSALVGVCKTLNIEGLFHGVLTKIIHPGFVDTPMVDTIDAEYFDKNLKPLIGLGRKIQPSEIADIICAMIENPVMSGEVWADASMTPFA